MELTERAIAGSWLLNGGRHGPGGFRVGQGTHVATIWRPEPCLRAPFGLRGGEGEAGEKNATDANKRGSASEKALLPRHVFAERLDAIWYARERASACTKTALRHRPKLDNVDIVN